MEFRKILEEQMGSKKADLILKSPQNIDGVIELVENSGGTVKPVFEVTYKDKKNGKKRTGKIKDEEISESMEIEVDGQSLENEIDNIIGEGKKHSSITYLSKSNETIYEENKHKILKFVK